MPRQTYGVLKQLFFSLDVFALTTSGLLVELTMGEYLNNLPTW